jgi:nitrogen PTS system EIIA component
MKKLFFANAALAALIAAPAMAADMPIVAPPVYKAPFSWSGCYGGFNAGYIGTLDRYDNSPSGAYSTIFASAQIAQGQTSYRPDGSSYTGGIQFACNYQWGGADVVFSALLKREELGSTGVGNGVAIPHVRLAQVKKPFGIMARLKHPIDFDSIDGEPVDLVCLLLLSNENEQAQLNTLAAVARRLRSSEVLEELRRAPNRVVFYNIMVGRTGRYRSQ